MAMTILLSKSALNTYLYEIHVVGPITAGKTGPHGQTKQVEPDHEQSSLRAVAPHHSRRARSLADHREMMACYWNAALRRRRRCKPPPPPPRSQPPEPKPR